MPGGVLVLQPRCQAHFLAVQERAAELGLPHRQQLSIRELAATGLLRAFTLDGQSICQPVALSGDELRPLVADRLRGSGAPAAQVVPEVRDGEQLAPLRAPRSLGLTAA